MSTNSLERRSSERKSVSKRRVALLLLGLASGMAPAETTAWKFDVTGTVPSADAARFSDSGNWTAGVPDGSTWTADLTGAEGSRYILLDRDITLAKLTGTFASGNVVSLYGDHRLTMDNGTSRADIRKIRLYAPVSVARDLLAGTDANFCGDIGGGTFTVSGDRVRHRLDLYANVAGGERQNPGVTDRLYFGAGSLIIHAPVGSSDEVTGLWDQTAGSPFVFRTGEAHPIPVGTLVRGSGVREGTFVKRIFSDSVVELSYPVEETLSSNSLAFDLIAQRVVQRIATFVRGGAAQADTLMIQKSRAEDDVRIEVGNLIANQDGAFLSLDVESSAYLPGTLVLHDAATRPLMLRLKTCSLEFGEVSEGKTAGVPTSTVFMEGAGSVATLTVTNGICAEIGTLSNLVGRLVKDGSGTLVARAVGTEAENTGALSVQGGVLRVTGTSVGVRSLSLGADATLELDATELSCGTFLCEAGARVAGMGTLVLPSGTELSSVKATFAAGVCVRVAGGVGEVAFAPSPALAPDEVGSPALWMDMSLTNRMELSEEDGAWRVRKVFDVRGEDGYPCATNVVLAPAWIPQGSLGHVYFEYVSTVSTDVALTRTLVWDRPISGIRTVFVVKDPMGRGGQLLGSTDRLQGLGHFMRPGGLTWEKPLFYANNNTRGAKNVKEGPLFVNGESADWTKGHPYSGGGTLSEAYQQLPMVIEVDPINEGAAADCFAFEHSAAERNGDQRLCECVIYTNELTAVQRRAVTRYLMNKWMGAEISCVRGPVSGGGLGTVDTAVVGGVSVAEGENEWADAVKGENAFVKAGKGTLYVEDWVDAAGRLEVREGTLSLGSGMTADEAGEGAYLHVDASDAASLVCAARDGGTAVTLWADRRGAGHPVASTFADTTNFPSLKTAEALQGLPVVDFGPLLAKESDPSWSSLRAATSMYFEPTQGLRTVIMLLGSRHGGGSLVGGNVGNSGNDSYNSGYGLFRGGSGHGASASEPLFFASAASLKGLMTAGAYRAAVNGKPVNVTTDGLSGGWDVVSYASVGTFGAGGFAGNHYNHYCGGQEIAETLIYPKMLSSNEVARVEAYLRGKWLGIGTPGCRPARLGSVCVSSGATLAVRGNPLTASSVSGSGAIDGDLTIASEGTLDVTVGADGTVPCLSVSGTADLTAGGTVRLDGAVRRLSAGDHVLLTADSLKTDAPWSVSLVSGRHSKDLALRAVGNALVLRVLPRGLAIVIK